MEIRKKLLVALVTAAAAAVPAVLWAGDGYDSLDSAGLSTDEILSDTAAPRDDSGGKLMTQIVSESKKGFPTSFSNEEVMTLMEASRILKESDRSLGMKVENIASKMSRFYAEKE